ncbi:hypothetical protein [Chitinivorax sp. B]|uniref:hypothetical protein n=1 Tax=Chitinivorax sp. B TaxID=2502235 RepID=UPI0010F848DA|nr:hypothetical protein [Chitinivorax sp. B]
MFTSKYLAINITGFPYSVLLRSPVNKFVKIVVTIIVIIGVSKLVQKVMLNKYDPKVVMTQLATEINATLPRQVDPVVTLTKVEFNGKLWQANYTVAKGNVIDLLKKDEIEAQAIQQICAGEMKRVLKENITIEYVIHYTDLQDTAQKQYITIPPNSCPST